ncbi:hypothetical protein M378DRAFT_399200 [Amanita muscaria Koide BX008]|uniref:Uncharacterized protein n=1 Tax=Amanita muscaria (strain Koide BX008) TaxID=946122 RepID=A0A0C2ST30_AMAMK|nr:hypothetical protein M378DRAFT_399200 [Amanita muscaria Koide BX008]
MDRLFYFWDTSCRGALPFQGLVSGLDGVLFNGLMENIEWFFNLHDKDNDGNLTKDESTLLSVHIPVYEIGGAYLDAVSRFVTCSKAGHALLPPSEDGIESAVSQSRNVC